MITVENKTIGEIVAEDYRTAQIFKNHDIDFCCKGNRSIQEACEAKSINPQSLINEIESIQYQGSEDATDYQSWPLELLADYIEKKHHRYVEERIPVLKAYLEKLCRVHGNRHPELIEIEEHFRVCGGELAAHMKKEELILFPFIRKMAKTKPGEEMRQPYFGTVENPIQMMMHEHDTEGERFRKIAELSDGFTPPADGCGTYRVTYALLQEFEADLHLHIHLENNILFPKSVMLEKELRG
jgi:regulator of cell morphogenesis and NO signaling